MEPGDEIILSTAKGMACRFKSSDVRAMGRTARGVTGIKFKLEGDRIVSMEVVPGDGTVTEDPRNAVLPEGVEEIMEPEDTAEEIDEQLGDENDDTALEDTGRPQILIVTSGGMGKRSYVEDYRLTRRGAKGVKNLNLRDGEEVVAAVKVQHGDELIITTERGQVVRISVDEIRIVGRASKGVKIMELRKGDRITGVARLIEIEGQKKPVPAEEPVVATETTAETQETNPPAPEQV